MSILCMLLKYIYVKLCMRVKQLEVDNQLFNIVYRLLEFWKNQLINRLFSENRQH